MALTPSRTSGERRVRFTLALRLYLLLITVFLPTVFAYYYYSFWIVESLHDTEIDNTIRMGSIRIEDWLDSFPDLTEIPASDLQRLERELGRIADEPNGIESATVFQLGRSLPLTFLAAFGASASRQPTFEDFNVLSQGGIRKVDIRRGEVTLLSVSAALRKDGSVRGVIHLTLQPQKIGLGRRMTHLRLTLILGAIAVMAVVGVGVASFFTVAVNRPILQLTGVMERASAGNLSALVDIQGGEFGLVAASYNQMMRRLKSSMDENEHLIEQVRRFNEELKGKIESATREVATKNAQLETANERLFVLQGQLTTLEKLATLGQISAIIAHELGTPLNAISGHLQLLLHDSSTDAGAMDRLRVIDAQVDRLTGIVRDVLKAMRVPSPRLRDMDLVVVAREAVDLFGPISEKRGITVTLFSEPDVPRILADADQVQQVFMNLFTNAMDAMKSGGRMRVGVRSGAGPNGLPGTWVCADVMDSGQGMDEETMRQAFEPFYTTKRVEANPADNARVGLGLSICRQIAMNHGGEIVVRSRKGEGTTFTFYLPVTPAAPALPPT